DCSRLEKSAIVQFPLNRDRYTIHREIRSAPQSQSKEYLHARIAGIMPLRKIGILIPTPREARGFIAAMKMQRCDAETYVCRLPGTTVILQVCGIGLNNARRQANRIAGQGIDLLLLAGFCGGLDAGLAVGDLVADNQSSDPRFSGRVAAIAASRNIGFHLGGIHTSPVVLWRAEDKTRLGRESGAIAVDMESGAVRDVCRMRDVPYGSFRTVSDTARQDLPSAMRHLTAEGKANLRMWIALACNPRDWFRARRLLAAARIAERHLTAALVDWIHE
ncbi:MAG TPA: hypothetical protein PLI07_09545, partial [Candidatus Hydrogenedentes bacterium]|nr:hypothetical protein [Candidatus Hydrogenedentota bacterium]